MEGTLALDCGHCDWSGSVPRDWAGKRVRCRGCKSVLRCEPAADPEPAGGVRKQALLICGVVGLILAAGLVTLRLIVLAELGPRYLLQTLGAMAPAAVLIWASLSALGRARAIEARSGGLGPYLAERVSRLRRPLGVAARSGKALIRFEVFAVVGTLVAIGLSAYGHVEWNLPVWAILAPTLLPLLAVAAWKAKAGARPTTCENTDPPSLA